MAVTDAARNQLFNTLREKFGAEDAATMMDLLPPVGWADVARRDDVDRLERHLDERMDRFDERMDRFEGRMDRFAERMDRFEGRMVGFDGALREQTRFHMTCLFAGNAAVIAVISLVVTLR